ncbi:hypothetical protein NBRC13296_12460 [Paenibacillus chitinolyticus]|uniref:hypothetical protein n=1 Tax=Paenibacillus chitinolyticus TaxID=79263 RepID=UPI003556905E
MLKRYTHFYGIELLEPVIVDDKSKIFEFSDLLKVIPTEYLELIFIELSKFKDESKVIANMAAFIEKIVLERGTFKETIKSIESMNPEFINHVNKVLRSMIFFESTKSRP